MTSRRAQRKVGCTHTHTQLQHTPATQQMPHLRIEAGGSEDYRGMLVLISLPLTIFLSTCLNPLTLSQQIRSDFQQDLVVTSFFTASCADCAISAAVLKACSGRLELCQPASWMIDILQQILRHCHRPSWCTGRMGSCCWLASVTSRRGSLAAPGHRTSPISRSC